MKIASTLLFLLLAAPAMAQDDPLKSDACSAALSALQAARGGSGNVEAARSAAAGTCLGSTDVPSRPGRVAQAPVAVPPPQIDIAPHATRPLPPVSLPPPPVAIERAPAPALCDANGCWAPGGSHLRHVPSVPAGVCIQQGGATVCP